MILKINKIKKLGIFDNYLPLTTLKDFKKYNLIYGWNGSGKTTLTKLFNSLETGINEEYPDLEYEIQNEISSKFTNGIQFNQRIRIFNQDYINNNLTIREGKTKSITLILGDASKEVISQIEEDEDNLFKKEANLLADKKILDAKEKVKDKIFSEVAKDIYTAIYGSAIRTYKSNNAKDDFKKLTRKNILSDNELDKLIIAVKQSPLPLIDSLINIEFDISNSKEKENLKDKIKKIIETTQLLLEEKVDSIFIERLRNNKEISNWVELGLKIHNDNNSKVCEFCNQQLPQPRMDELLKYFNEADKILKEKINILIEEIKTVKEKIEQSKNIPDTARFYKELMEEYKKLYIEFPKITDSLLIDIERFLERLKDKKSKTTESEKIKDDINLIEFEDAFSKINEIINIHNKKTSAFEKEQEVNIGKIKEHYLSSISEEVDNIEEEINKLKSNIEILTNGDQNNPEDLGINQLKLRINENRSKVSSTQKACSEINDGLETFLGRKELLFEPNKIKTKNESGNEAEIDNGYLIKRDDKIVKNLSEGEKTAIAFVYFTIHLKDPSFNKEKGIIVIDDPISSLDSNSIFQAFSFLKNSVKNAQQIFILTHNFDFLKLLLNWLGHYSIKKDSSFYMINNKDTSTGREAFIDKLDEDLEKYETEYNYLFNKLINFESNGTIESVYNIPNITRKVLDTFLMFRVPNNDSLYDKLEYLKAFFDENKITAIYKFANNESHITGKGFDPCLVPETQKIVKYILEFIKTTFPDHYKILTTK